MQTFENLTRRQQAIIPLLIEMPTLRSAADKIGINQSTLMRWLKLPEFIKAYREARYVVMSEAFMNLQKNCNRATEVLVELMEDEETPHAVRYNCACAILDMAMRTRTIDELEERLEAIEQAQYTTITVEAS